jgi:hypothetical protein
MDDVENRRSLPSVFVDTMKRSIGRTSPRPSRNSPTMNISPAPPATIIRLQSPSDDDISYYVPSEHVGTHTFFAHGVYSARESVINLPPRALQRWTSTLQNELDVELGPIRSKAVRKFKDEQERAKIEKPELRLSGRRPSGSNDGVSLSVAVWVLCGSKWCQEKVKKRLGSRMPPGWTLEVHVGASVWGAVHAPTTLDLNLERPIRLQEDMELYLHVETPDDGGSACGRLVCSTVVVRGDVVDQRISRLGGRLDISSNRLVITTAHGMVEHLMAVSQPVASAPEPSAPPLDSCDESDDSCTEEGDDDDLQAELEATPRGRIGYKDPSSVSCWKTATLGGPARFLGMRLDELVASDRSVRTPFSKENANSSPRSTDFAVLDVPEIASAENTYITQGDQQANRTRVRRFQKGDDTMVGNVEVLVDDSRPEKGFLLRQSSSISVRGITLETRKVEIREPLGRLPTIPGAHLWSKN